MRRLLPVLVGIVLLPCSCASAGYAFLGLATIEPTANPPIGEAQLRVPQTLTFPDARPRTLGVCIQATPGDRYAIELTNPDGRSFHTSCEAQASCGFEESCVVGAMTSGSRVVCDGKAPARCVLHEAHGGAPAGWDIFGAAAAAVLLLLGAIFCFVFAATMRPRVSDS